MPISAKSDALASVAIAPTIAYRIAERIVAVVLLHKVGWISDDGFA